MLIPYNPAAHEQLLVHWFFNLKKTGDLDKVFFKDLHTLTAFLNYYANGVKLAFTVDKDGISLAAWVRPILDAGEFGLWIREDKRHSPSSLRSVYEAYDDLFKRFAVLMGVSKQQHLRKLHEKLGYEVSIEIPNAWDGEPVQIYHLTREAYEHGRNGIRTRTRTR